MDKVAIRQNYIYYHYKKGGAKTGYCTYCEKEVPIKVHPHHNQKAAVVVAAIRWYSKPMDERGICRQKNILPT